MDQQDPQYSPALGRALGRALERDPLAEDPRLVAAVVTRLLRLTTEQQALWLRNARNTGGLATCRRLLAIAETKRQTEPREALRAAQAAVMVSESLSGNRYPLSLIADARAEAWACQANAQRVVGDLREAEQSWWSCDFHHIFGSGDPLLDAKLFHLKASLRISQRKLRQAIELLQRAIEIYSAHGERHLEGRTYLNLARALDELGRPKDAIQASYDAISRLDRNREPSLKLVAIHNLIGYLEGSGRNDLALAALERAQPLYSSATSFPIASYHRLRGRLAANLGRYDVAIESLEAARSCQLEIGRGYDAALVTLELALFHSRVGRFEAVLRLAREAYGFFSTQDIPEAAQAALVLFVQSAQEHQISATAIEGLLQQLQAQRPV